MIYQFTNRADVALLSMMKIICAHQSRASWRPLRVLSFNDFTAFSIAILARRTIPFTQGETSIISSGSDVSPMDLMKHIKGDTLLTCSWKYMLHTNET